MTVTVSISLKYSFFKIIINFSLCLHFFPLVLVIDDKPLIRWVGSVHQISLIENCVNSNPIQSKFFRIERTNPINQPWKTNLRYQVRLGRVRQVSRLNAHPLLEWLLNGFHEKKSHISILPFKICMYGITNTLVSWISFSKLNVQQQTAS